MDLLFLFFFFFNCFSLLPDRKHTGAAADHDWEQATRGSWQSAEDYTASQTYWMNEQARTHEC